MGLQAFLVFAFIFSLVIMGSFNVAVEEIAVPADTEVPIKNTFVHFDASDSDYELPPRQEATCPDLVQRRAFRTKTFEKRRAQKKAQLHESKQCKPCAYYAYKADGCRL